MSRTLGGRAARHHNGLNQFGIFDRGQIGTDSKILARYHPPPVRTDKGDLGFESDDRGQPVCRWVSQRNGAADRAAGTHAR